MKPPSAAFLALVLVVALMAACSVHATSGPAGLKAPNQVVSATADTDRGLTPTTMTIGAMVYRQDTFAQFGLGSLGGKPVEDLLKPLVDEINAHGGIAGRRVALAVTRFSPLVPAEAQTACVDQADDKKVFVTLAEISLTGDAQERCLAAHQTAVVTSNSSSLADLQADRGWVHQTSMAKDRVFKNWVDWLVSSGTATPASRIGLLRADTPEDNALADKVFLPYLNQRGLKVVAQAAFSGTSVDTATADAQNAALKFKSSGVDLVLPDLDFLRFFVFLGAASVNDLTAKYSVSDLGQLTLDVATSFYPASFDGSQGITAYAPDLSRRAQGTPGPALQDCLAVIAAGGQQLSSSPMDHLADLLQVAQFCEDLRLVSQVASLAGPHLNRASFVAAFGKLANYGDRVTMTGPLTYGPSKFDGPDSYAVIKWQAKCASGDSCYAQVAPAVKGRW